MSPERVRDPKSDAADQHAAHPEHNPVQTIAVESSVQKTDTPVIDAGTFDTTPSDNGPTLVIDGGKF